MLSQLQGQSAAGRIMSVKNPSEPTANHTRDLPGLAQCLNQLLHSVVRDICTAWPKCQLTGNIMIIVLMTV